VFLFDVVQQTQRAERLTYCDSVGRCEVQLGHHPGHRFRRNKTCGVFFEMVRPVVYRQPVAQQVGQLFCRPLGVGPYQGSRRVRQRHFRGRGNSTDVACQFCQRKSFQPEQPRRRVDRNTKIALQIIDINFSNQVDKTKRLHPSAVVADGVPASEPGQQCSRP
jgi:hypothetical protein